MEKIYMMLEGRKIELPKYTLKVIDFIDEEMAKEKEFKKGLISIKECIMAQYQFLINILGKETVDELFGIDIEEINMAHMIKSVYLIIQRYTLEIQDTNHHHQKARPNKRYKK